MCQAKRKSEGIINLESGTDVDFSITKNGRKDTEGIMIGGDEKKASMEYFTSIPGRLEDLIIIKNDKLWKKPCNPFFQNCIETNHFRSSSVLLKKRKIMFGLIKKKSEKD